MIRSLFWNIRGIRKQIAVSRLIALKQQYNLKLICICEPHVDVSQIVEFQFKLGYKKVLQNQANRIWVFLDDSLSASIHSQSDQFLSVKFAHNAFSTKFLVTFVHAHCTK